MSIAATDTKRRALGKGLDSLLPRVQPPAPALRRARARRRQARAKFPSSRSTAIPSRPARIWTRSSLAELAASITANGVVQPILVRPQANGRFQLIAGERRWRASQLAGKTTIPAILRQVSDEQAMEITIVENLQRADLNPMEQARAFERLSREFHMTQEQMAQRTGKDRATVANFLRLLKLPASVQARVETGELELRPRPGAAGVRACRGDRKGGAAGRRTFAFCSPDGKLCAEASSTLSKARKRSPSPSRLVDPNVREVQERLQRALGLKVTIEDNNGRGKVIIEYARLEDFDTLLERLNGK